MKRRYLLLVIGGLLTGLSGCRCCCLFEPYNDLIDGINDRRWIFDPWYCPRLDISRAGKPDWCGPINRHLGCCCCNCTPEWTRYDDIWLYPPRYPNVFPNDSYPGPSQSEPPRQIKEIEEMEMPESAPLDPPAPGILSEPPLPDPPPPDLPK